MNNQIKKILFFLLGTVLPYTANATVQRDSIYVVGSVRHALTQRQLDGAMVRVLNPADSSVVTATYTDDVRILMGLIPSGSSVGGNTNIVFRFSVPKTGKYLVQVRLLGFKQKTVEVEIPKRAKEWTMPDILLSEEAHTLGEATVKASRLMMVMRGDTVVYNADAFQLSEGSMLDKLFQLMPGFEIKPGGAIYVNGRYVESLLLNGKDFFKGNPNVALENLPAYTVKEVKVYDRADESAYLDGKAKSEKENKPLAVDVVLKKEYAQGWMMNAEGGYGTGEVYNARAFVMRYTDQSRLTLFGNVNNVNLAVSPTDGGDWNGDNFATSGRTERKAGGLDFNLTGRHTRTELSTSLMASREDNDLRNETSSTTFLPSAGNYLRQRSEADERNTNMHWANKLTYPGKTFYLRFTSDVKYGKGKSINTVRSAQFTEEPYESSRLSALDSIFASPSQRFQDILTNRYQQNSLNDSKNWSAGGTVFTKFNGKATLYNPMEITIGGNYNKNEAKAFGLDDLRYADGKENDYRHTFSNSPRTNYNLQGSWQYGWKSGIVRYTIGYNFRREHDRATRDYFRLDRVAQSAEDSLLGILPSNWEALRQVALDTDNSYTGTRSLNSHETWLTMNIGTEKMGWFYVKLPYRRTSESYTDVRLCRENQRASRKNNFFSPYVEYTYGMQASPKGRYSIGYTYAEETPLISYFIDADDTTNPLVLQKGNHNLEDTRKHHVKADYMHQDSNGHLFFFFDYYLYKSAMAQALTYDATTGVSTYQPRNVNGNWSIKGDTDFHKIFKRNKQWSCNGNANLTYSNSADYVSLDGLDAVRSSVRNMRLDEWTAFTFRQGKYYVRGEEQVVYSYAASDREGFQKRNTFDFLLGIRFNADLPWRLAFNTSLFLYSRRGYDDASMNDNNLVWNATLSRPVDRKGSWTLKLRGNDILHQLSTVRRTLNAQCLTETHTNSLPSFFLFSLSYKLHILPKKKTK